jgi:hypothetical protein
MNEDLKKALVEQKRLEQNETRAILDTLRRTRKARGGVGAPLLVPAHLGGNAVVLTDPDTVEEMNEIAVKEREQERADPAPLSENED